MKSKWARFPGAAALYQIHQIQRQVTGRALSLNTSCSTCILRLLTEMGNIYFADKAERESQRKVEVIPDEVTTQEKVEVKTQTKKGRKPKAQK